MQKQLKTCPEQARLLRTLGKWLLPASALFIIGSADAKAQEKPPEKARQGETQKDANVEPGWYEKTQKDGTTSLELANFDIKAYFQKLAEATKNYQPGTESEANINYDPVVHEMYPTDAIPDYAMFEGYLLESKERVSDHFGAAFLIGGYVTGSPYSRPGTDGKYTWNESVHIASTMSLLSAAQETENVFEKNGDWYIRDYYYGDIFMDVVDAAESVYPGWAKQNLLTLLKFMDFADFRIEFLLRMAGAGDSIYGSETLDYLIARYPNTYRENVEAVLERIKKAKEKLAAVNEKEKTLPAKTEKSKRESDDEYMHNYDEEDEAEDLRKKVEAEKEAIIDNANANLTFFGWEVDHKTADLLVDYANGEPALNAVEVAEKAITDRIKRAQERSPPKLERGNPATAELPECEVPVEILQGMDELNRYNLQIGGRIWLADSPDISSVRMAYLETVLMDGDQLVGYRYANPDVFKSKDRSTLKESLAIAIMARGFMDKTKLLNIENNPEIKIDLTLHNISSEIQTQRGIPFSIAELEKAFGGKITELKAFSVEREDKTTQVYLAPNGIVEEGYPVLHLSVDYYSGDLQPRVERLTKKKQGGEEEKKQ